MPPPLRCACPALGNNMSAEARHEDPSLPGSSARATDASERSLPTYSTSMNSTSTPDVSSVRSEKAAKLKWTVSGTEIERGLCPARARALGRELCGSWDATVGAEAGGPGWLVVSYVMLCYVMRDT